MWEAIAYPCMHRWEKSLVRAVVHIREAIITTVSVNLDNGELAFGCFVDERHQNVCRPSYGAGKKLSNQEVSALLRKLVLRGMLSSAKKK